MQETGICWGTDSKGLRFHEGLCGCKQVAGEDGEVGSSTLCHVQRGDIYIRMEFRYFIFATSTLLAIKSFKSFCKLI